MKKLPIDGKNLANTIKVKEIGFELTDKCNVPCRLCFKKKPDTNRTLPFEKIIEVIDNPMFAYPIDAVHLMGNEPLTHPSINVLFESLTQYILKGRIATIGLMTNGYDETTLMNLLAENEEYTRCIQIVFSMRGFGTEHDSLLGVEGAFTRTLKTIKRVSEQYPEIVLRMIFAVYPSNIRDMKKAYEFCSLNNIKLYFSFAGSSVFDPADERDAFRQNVSFSNDLKEKIVDNLREILEMETTFHGKILYMRYLSSAIKYLRNELHIESCFTPEYDLMVDKQGDLYPCLYQKPVANIFQKDWSGAFHESTYLSIIAQAQKGNCPGCFDHLGYLRCRNFNKKYSILTDT